MPEPHDLPVLDAEEQRALGARREAGDRPRRRTAHAGRAAYRWNQTAPRAGRRLRRADGRGDREAAAPAGARARWCGCAPPAHRYHERPTERLDLANDERPGRRAAAARPAAGGGPCARTPSGCTGSPTVPPSRNCLAGLALRAVAAGAGSCPGGPARRKTRWAGTCSDLSTRTVPRPADAGAARADVDLVERARRRTGRRDAGVVAAQRRGGGGVRRAARRRAGRATSAERWLAAWSGWRGNTPSSRRAAVPATPRHTSPPPGPTRPASTCRRRWSSRPGSGTRTAPTGSGTCARNAPAGRRRGGRGRRVVLPDHLAASELPAAVAALVRRCARPAPAGRDARGRPGAAPRLVVEREVSLDFVLHDPAEVAGLLEAAGLVDVGRYAAARAHRAARP